MCLQNFIGISAKLRALGPGQRFDYKFWILQQWLQTYQTHIGPTLHVGLNYYTMAVNLGSNLTF